MQVPPEPASGEVVHLQRCINDLVSLLALPSIWSGGDPSQILHTLLDALLRMLRLDLVCVQLKNPLGEAPVEIVRIAEMRGPMPPVHEICEALGQSFADDSRKWPALLRDLMGEGDVSIAPLPLGLQGELGVIVVAAGRADFPRQTETLLLSVAANQALIGIQEARLLSEQKRVANELDQRVVQRTAELAALNEQLKKELAERRLVEEKLGQEERELKRSEVRKAAIVDAALDCIVTIDHEGCITEFNPAAERTFGYRRDQVLGKHLADVIVPSALREKHRQGFARYVALGEARMLGKRIEMTAVRADGSEFPVELAISRIPLEGPPSFTGYLRDITERKQAEQALRRSEAFLAEAQHLSHTGSFSWRVATDEITWSEQLYRIYQLEIGTPVTLALIRTRVHPEDLTLYERMVEEARVGGNDFEWHYRLLMSDHSIKYMHALAQLTRDHDGQLEYIAAVQDVTVRKLAEEARDKARSELAHVARVTSLGTLTASIAHELNQPLSGVVTNANTCVRMLAADPPNVDGARETARRTIRDANRASEMMTRLRALFGKKPATVQSLDLNEAISEVIALSLSELQKNRIVLRPELATGLPLVNGDRVQIQQVILNLLRNASDAMSTIDDRPRDLLIRTEPEGDDRVCLSVGDVGIGFEPQAADKLFEAFYTTKSDGMGIGLSVSRSIIERHQGRLWATPNSGPGVTFSFSIPCKLEDETNNDDIGAGRIPSVSDLA